MSAKVKVISKTSKSAKNIIAKLNDFLKTGDYTKHDIGFLRENFKKLKHEVDRYIKCIEIISESNYLKLYQPEIQTIAKLYFTNIKSKSNSFNDTYTPEYFINYFTEHGTEPSNDEYQNIINFYTNSRDHVIINYILHTCNECKQKTNNVPIIPFYDFNAFDLNELSKKENCPNLSTAIKNKLNEVSLNVYKIINTPNIDVDKFIKIVFDALEELEKQIPRCKKAFELIKNSMSLFKENFYNYNMEYNITQNPISIIEGFVKDVKEKNKVMNPTTIREFVSIIKHFSNSKSSEFCDPDLLKAMNAGTDLLTSETSKLEKIIECEKTGEEIPSDITPSTAPNIMDIFSKLTDNI